MDQEAASVDRFAKALGRLVKEARDAAGMSQLGLDREAGIPGSTVAKLERGELFDLPVHVLRRIADALGVDAASLIPSAADEDVSG